MEKIGEMAGSFGRVAETYDRVRPGPAPAAVDWLVPAGCGAAVDLAAGTGLFTRALLGRVPEITAVEPDGRMRAVLAVRTEGVRVLDGRGEVIPLPDASVDGVFVSTAWHWFDPALAIPEIARVLRDGGRLGIIWTSRDRADDSQGSGSGTAGRDGTRRHSPPTATARSRYSRSSRRLLLTPRDTSAN